MFQTYLIEPIYNFFVLLISFMPYGDAGLAIIALTILMRVVLYPVFTSSIRAQMGMQAMQAELEGVQEKYKNDPQALARERVALMRKHKINPLAMFGGLAVQLLVFIGLSFALFHEGFPEIKTELLYSFVPAPEVVSTTFFGLLDLLTPHHIILALLVALTQYLAIRLTIRRTNTTMPALTGERAAAMQMQQKTMLYIMPAAMGIASYFFLGAMGLYFLVNNIFSIAQEWLIAKQK